LGQHRKIVVCEMVDVNRPALNKRLYMVAENTVKEKQGNAPGEIKSYMKDMHNIVIVSRKFYIFSTGHKNTHSLQ